MMLAEQSALLSAGTLLVAPGTPLPPAWRIEAGSVARGWTRLAHTTNSHEFDTELVTPGWTFFFMAGAITATAFGLTRLRRLDTALARIIAGVRLQRCNCLQIDDVWMRWVLGMPYVSISGHCRHIQKGIIFSGQ